MENDMQININQKKVCETVLIPKFEQKQKTNQKNWT